MHTSAKKRRKQKKKTSHYFFAYSVGSKDYCFSFWPFWMGIIQSFHISTFGRVFYIVLCATQHLIPFRIFPLFFSSKNVFSARFFSRPQHIISHFPPTFFRHRWTGARVQLVGWSPKIGYILAQVEMGEETEETHTDRTMINQLDFYTPFSFSRGREERGLLFFCQEFKSIYF